MNEEYKVVVFTDTHWWDSPLRNRISYVDESIDLYDRMFDIVLNQRKLNPKAKLIVVFLGDVFHKDGKNITNSIQWYQRLFKLRSLVDKVYLVVGNHEISWNKDNVFWTLVDEIDSITAPVAGNFAKGIIGMCEIKDYIDIFDTRLHFVHYHGRVTDCIDGNNLAFVHDDWLCPELVNIIQKRDNVDLKTQYIGYMDISNSDIISQLDCVFLGHNHKARGVYELELKPEKITTFHYLMSLGRTSKDQVFDTTNERSIPVITINEDGYTVDLISFDLPTAKDVMDMDSVEKNDKAYAKQVKNREIRKQQINGKDPVKSIENILIDIPDALDIFKDAQQRKRADWVKRVMS